MIPFKVCCIRDPAEVELARRAGARWVGLVGPMPSGPGPIPEARIRGIVAGMGDGPTPVLLTARTTADEVGDHLGSTGMADRLETGGDGAVQLVRSCPPDVRVELRDRFPSLEILQVLHVEGPGSVDAVERHAGAAHHLLLDSGRPGATVEELGGTGRTHDWSLSRRIVERSPVPVLLAGGLRPENVAEAVRTVGPAGVDVCSGLRDGERRLLPERLDAFARVLRAS